MAKAKIATCCYCGARSVVSMRPAKHDALACSACGAPLSRLKPIKAPPATPERASAVVTKERLRAAPESDQRDRAKARRKKKRQRKSASPLRKLWKALDDVFDEVEDLFD